MIIYLINIIFITIWGYCLVYNKPTKKKKKIFLTISSLQWILVSGLRNPSVGADTAGYIRSFDRVKDIKWQEVFNVFVDVYFRGRTPANSSENFMYKDPGYLVFQKIIHLFTDNSRIFLVIIAIIIFLSLSVFLYKYSDDLVLSYILFSTLFYSFYAITGIRQTLATALIVFVGFRFIRDRDLWKFLLISLVAFTLHKSVVVFIPFYFLSRKEITRKYIFTLVCLTGFLFLLGPNFLLKVSRLLGYNREDVYQANTANYVFVMVVLGIALFIFYKKIQKRDNLKILELNAIFFAVILSLLSLIDQSMMRIQQYYALFLMLVIPDIVNCFNIRSRRMLRLAGIGVMILYLISNNPKYMFFWQ